MTREEKLKILRTTAVTPDMHPDDFGKWDEAFRSAIEALSAEPCREADDYENEIADLHNSLDIAEYDKERLREEVTALEEKLKALSAEPCEDAISRQAVMDFIRGLTRWCVRSEDGKFNNVGLLYDDVMFGLDRLPSVTPKQKRSNCTDCIIDGTDACSRGAGRAVDGRVCEDFVGESED